MPAQRRTSSKRSSIASKPARAAVGHAGATSLTPVRRRQLARDLGKVVSFVGGGQARSRQSSLATAVDFPTFVAGLIDGVFQAIVKASIEQMDAYGDLLEGVARSVDQFARDNVSAGRARDWLSQTYAELSDDTGESGDTGDSGDEDDAASKGRRALRGGKRRRLTPGEQRALVGAVTLLGIDRLLLARNGRRARRETR